jgi:mannose-6-phosphate isomerase-like protein (cupin superfamily)
MADEVKEPVKGDGYALANVQALGDGPGFRKIRRELGVEEMGVNAIVMPSGYEAGVHWHDQQEELYFVHAGEIEMEFGDGSSHRLGPGGVARVAASTRRRVKSVGEEDAVYVVVGAKGGYVGRDGRTPEGEERGRRSEPAA